LATERRGEKKERSQGVQMDLPIIQLRQRRRKEGGKEKRLQGEATPLLQHLILLFERLQRGERKRKRKRRRDGRK